MFYSLLMFFFSLFFFFNDPAPSEIYTLSLHDALPICLLVFPARNSSSSTLACPAKPSPACPNRTILIRALTDRKSTRLNSSHVSISYAVFCLKKKKKKYNTHHSHPTQTHLTPSHTTPT